MDDGGGCDCGGGGTGATPAGGPAAPNGAPCAPGIACTYVDGDKYYAGAWGAGADCGWCVGLLVDAWLSLPLIGDVEDLAGMGGCSFRHLECGRWSSIPISGVGLASPVGARLLSRSDEAADLLRRNVSRGEAAEDLLGVGAKKGTNWNPVR